MEMMDKDRPRTRRHYQGQEQSTPAQSPEELVERLFLRRIVAEALAEIRHPIWREIMHLRVHDERSYADIARILEIDEQKVREIETCCHRIIRPYLERHLGITH